ncbi:hypothetical protein OG735_02305 [Streptomyces sp. NBC_01210]|uniref:hypothetical protein n=1 Tax=Streptomyces sp. NBC_01210 TaxID=2903774 RepID=UPI002E155FED|nr:hypothetical protein OG735_02305 [Streptomyces sp. NBC_01210]
MQPRKNERIFTLSSQAGSNVVESAAILMEFVAAPHKRWAELAKRMHDTEHVGTTPLEVRVPLTNHLFVLGILGA